MPAESILKAVFFDAAGTLFHLPRGVGFHYAQVARSFGVSLDEEKLSAAFRAAWKEMPARSASDSARPDDDRGWWRELVEKVLDRCDVSPQALDRERYFAALYEHFTEPGVWELYPEVPGVLETLQGRCVLGIISNFDGRLRPILENLGVARHFQHVLISSEVGADKPDPRIFRRALAVAGAAPGDAWHVGDDPDADWAGAERVGMQVFRLSRPQNSLSDLLPALGVTSRAAASQ